MIPADTFKLPMTEEKLKLLQELVDLAALTLASIPHVPGVFHDPLFQKCGYAPNWWRVVRLYHDNPWGRGDVEGCLDNLEKLAGMLEMKKP